MQADAARPNFPAAARGRVATPVCLALAAFVWLGGWTDIRAEADPLRTFTGHTSAVSSVAFAPDGERLLSGSFDGTARLWDVHTGETARVFDEHEGWVRAVAFAPDGGSLLTAGEDGEARVRDAATGETRHLLTDHTGSITAALFCPAGTTILTAGADGTVRLWDAGNGQLMRSFQAHDADVSAAAFSSDGARILTGGRDETVRLWESGGGESLRTFHGHTGPVTSVGFIGDGASAFSSALDGTVRLWNTATGEETRRFDTPGVTSATGLAPPAVILAGNAAGRTTLWDVFRGETLREFGDHNGPIGATALSPDGLTVLTGGGDGAIKLWKTFHAGHAIRLSGTLAFDDLVVGESRERLLVIRNQLAVPIPLSTQEPPEGFSVSGLPDSLEPGQMRTVTVTFSPRDEHSYEGELRLWSEALEGDTKRPLRGTGVLFDPLFSTGNGEEAFFAAAFSRDGTSLLTAGARQRIDGWDLENGGTTLALEGHEDTVYSLAISPNDTHLLTGSGDRTARLWNAETGEEVRRFEGHTDTVTTAAFSPDGSRIVTASFDESLRIWDRVSGELLRQIPAHDRWTMAAAFSPDGKSILSSGSDAVARLWDAETGELIRGFDGATGPVHAATFTPDGNRILTGGRGGSALLWDTHTGDLLRTYPDTQSWITSLDVSPDGKRFLTGTMTGEVRLRELETGKLLRTFRAHDQVVRAVRFSPDGNRIVSASPDGHVRVWDAVVNPSLTYQSWSETIPFPSQRGAADTPFSDSTSNLIKYALGFEPDSPRSRGGVFRITPNAEGTAQLEFTRNARRYDTTLTVELSTDLKTWQPVARAEGAGPFFDLGHEAVEVAGDLNQRTVRIADERNPTERLPLFFRLHVSKH